MVTRGTYFDEDEQYSRRYSNRGHGGYALSHDREHPLPPAPHHTPYARQPVSSCNPQNNRQSSEQDAAPRRRIPVACGRCRKRKIRCSGDPGHGQPCINCKTAGNETCQFLRVSSTEAQMKNEGADFAFDPAATASRVHCRMSPYGSQHQTYNQHITSLGTDSFPPYRHSSLSAYQPIKYYGISSFGDFTDESVDYGMHTSQYPLLNQEPINIPYPSIGSVRGWSQTQLPKSNSLFVEQDSSYNHCQLPFYSNPFPYRPHTNTESKSLPLHSMAPALSPSATGNDRVLPAPPPIPLRTAQVAGPYLRSTIENNLPVSQAQIHSYTNHGLMSNQMINAVKSLSASSSTESIASSSYLPLSSSPPESVPSSHMSYGTHSVSSSQQNNDGYTPGPEPSQQSLFHHPNSLSDNVGSYSTSSTRRSIGSHNGENEQPLTHHGNGSLVNGHYYVPPVSTQYPIPPVGPTDRSDMEPATAPIRQSVTAT